ncbi:MAG: hypothetical protein RMJ35_04665 [Phycisphaerales bacterium]|nr:hypothetical protein [Phycisphaerales bacterium]
MLRFLVSFFVLVTSVLAEPALPRGGGRVNLPYTLAMGDRQWIVQRGGWLQQQGNMPLLGQAANITADGQAAQGNINTAVVDKATGEIVIEGLSIAGLSLTRRILFNSEEGWCRYIDIFSNGLGAAVNTTITMQTSLNFGVNGGELVNDPKKESQVIAWIAPTAAGPVALELWAGPGTPLAPEVNWQPGNSFIQVAYPLQIAPGGRVAIVHLHAAHPSVESARQFIEKSTASRLLKGVPFDVRKAIANFRVGGLLLGERELLRGESLDVIELRTGDQLRGTLGQRSFRLRTAFGEVEAPAEKVIGMLSAGSFRPRQLVVTGDGEIIGGTLSDEAIELELSSGQRTAVPLGQISRLGYRKRPGEPEEPAFSKPMVELRSGDRLAFVPPAEPVQFLTRFGRVSLPLESFASIDLTGTEAAAHVAVLSDGSRFGGLLLSENLQLKLTTTGQTVTFPAGAIARIMVSAEQPDPRDGDPTLALAGGDVLVARLTGTLQLETAFDTLALNADEIVALAPLKESGLDVQVTLWDQTTVSGQLREPILDCILAGDVPLRIPLALLSSYRQPNPRPSATVVKQISSMVAELSAEDFRLRESAEERLIKLGPVVVPVLKELRDAQPLEAQQRIDSIIKRLLSQ